ncbi:DUF1844 domain-containing protein [bacterium]|nr:DUF1844 domain-containing protein [bacterium]
MDEEPKVTDKRRVNADGTLKEENVEQSPAEEPKAGQTAEPTQEAASADDEQAGMPPPNVYATMEFMVSMLAEQAWMLMGLRLAPGQKEISKDLTQAKVAIDTVVFIVDKLQPYIEEQDRTALRGLISDLQLNFVRQNQ